MESSTRGPCVRAPGIQLGGHPDGLQPQRPRRPFFHCLICSRPAPKLASPASASALLRPGSSSSQQLAASARRATPTPLPSRASRGAPVAPAFCLILESHVGILLSVPWRCQMMEGLPVPVPAAADPALTARLGLS